MIRTQKGLFQWRPCRGGSFLANWVKKGYTFESISIEHYERAYKDEILNLYNTSKLSGKTEDSVKEILHLLLTDLRKPGESIEEKLEIKASVFALNTMLKMDGIKGNDLDKITSEGISDMLDWKIEIRKE